LSEETLKKYIKCYKNFLSKDLCKQTISKLNKQENKNTYQKHSFYNVYKNTSISFKNELKVSWVEIPEKQIIQNKLWFAIEQYILKDFKCDWFCNWQGYEQLRFNKYDVNTNMKKHCDHIHSMFSGEKKGVPILSIVGVLNDNYEGGDFIMFEDTKIELPTGSILIFPSNFMYPHKVTSIAKGVRHSFVSWVY